MCRKSASSSLVAWFQEVNMLRCAMASIEMLAKLQTGLIFRRTHRWKLTAGIASMARMWKVTSTWTSKSRACRTIASFTRITSRKKASTWWCSSGARWTLTNELICMSDLNLNRQNRATIDPKFALFCLYIFSSVSRRASQISSVHALFIQNRVLR